LRKAFPAVKFKVQYNGERVIWTDDGPTVEQVQKVILQTGHATEKEAWDGSKCLRLSQGRGSTIQFDRYNVVEHEAAKAEHVYYLLVCYYRFLHDREFVQEQMDWLEVNAKEGLDFGEFKTAPTVITH
jgi:hypothetical protein